MNDALVKPLTQIPVGSYVATKWRPDRSGTGWTKCKGYEGCRGWVDSEGMITIDQDYMPVLFLKKFRASDVQIVLLNLEQTYKID